jgi:hypothetical protein
MKQFLILLLIIIGALTLAACDLGPQSARGFTLPEGDVARGETTYSQLECNVCHTIDGVQQFDSAGAPEISVVLGGEVSRIKTYGELVTSVINPSHRLAQGFEPEAIQTDDGQSKMRNYNDVMRVSELIDLVAFLQSKYELRKYEPTYYPIWGPMLRDDNMS